MVSLRIMAQVRALFPFLLRKLFVLVMGASIGALLSHLVFWFPRDKGTSASDVIPAESLRILGQSRPFSYIRQDMSAFSGAKWPNNAQMLARDTQAGDWIDLAIPVEKPGRFRVTALMTHSFDFGTVRFWINGRAIPVTANLNSGGPVQLGPPLVLGVFDLFGKQDRLRLEVTEDSSHRGNFFGIAGLKLEPMPLAGRSP